MSGVGEIHGPYYDHIRENGNKKYGYLSFLGLKKMCFGMHNVLSGNFEFIWVKPKK
jgi:hypothetical protein